MYNHLSVALNAVIPMFLVIGLGYFVRSRKWVDVPELQKFNLLSFRLFLPCHLFKTVLTSSWTEDFQIKFVLFNIFCVLLIFFLAVITTLRFEKGSEYRGVMIQGIFRSNFILLGLPLVSAIYDSDHTGSASIMIAIIIPLFNILAVIVLEIFHNAKVCFSKIFLDILKNPLILGTVSGLFLKLLNIHLEKIPILFTAVSYLAQIATPLLLFILGATFRPAGLHIHRSRILFCVLGKLMIVPSIVFSLGILLGFQGVNMAVLLAAFASPPATNSYTMVQQMGGDPDLASGIIIVGTAVSCFTMVFWILLLKSLAIL